MCCFFSRCFTCLSARSTHFETRPAPVAIPLSCQVAHQCREFVAGKGTRCAVLGKIRVFAAEYLPVGGIVLQSGLRVLLVISAGHSRLVTLCLAQLALAVPSVAGLVLVPERVIHGAHCSPIDHVVGTRVGRSGGYPFEVRIDVRLGSELFPFGGILRPQYRGVVLGLQPCTIAVLYVGRHVLYKLPERFQLPLCVHHLRRDVLLHTVHAKGGKHVYIMPQLIYKIRTRHRHTSHRRVCHTVLDSVLENTARLAVQVLFHIVVNVELLFVDIHQRPRYRLHIKAHTRFHKVGSAVGKVVPV